MRDFNNEKNPKQTNDRFFKRQINIRLSSQMEYDLKRLGKQKGMTRSELMRIALLEFIHKYLET